MPASFCPSAWSRHGPWERASPRVTGRMSRRDDAPVSAPRPALTTGQADSAGRVPGPENTTRVSITANKRWCVRLPGRECCESGTLRPRGCYRRPGRPNSRDWLGAKVAACVVSMKGFKTSHGFHECSVAAFLLCLRSVAFARSLLVSFEPVLSAASAKYHYTCMAHLQGVENMPDPSGQH